MRRKKDDSLELYRQKARDFFQYEQGNIESFEQLAKCRNIVLEKEIRLFITYFQKRMYFQRPDCIIYLYNFLEESKKEAKVSVNTIFDYTAYRFKKYGEILEERGVTL